MGNENYCKGIKEQHKGILLFNNIVSSQNMETANLTAVLTEMMCFFHGVDLREGTAEGITNRTFPINSYVIST